VLSKEQRNQTHNIQDIDAFEAMLTDPEANVHMQEAARVAEKFEPHLYEVSFVDEA
jgi:hypothetical protein